MASSYINRMKLKRIEDNHNFIVDVNNFESVYEVKIKLSSISNLKCDDIILIHKNRVLKNNNLVEDYKIGENDFVLFGTEEMNYRCSDESNNQYKKSYFEKYCFRCREKIIEPRNNQLNLLNDDKEIRVVFRDVNREFMISTNRNRRIFDALKERVFDLGKCAKCIPYELIFYGRCLDVNRTFADYYHIRNDETIRLEKRLNKCILSISMTMKCINGHYDPFQISTASSIFYEISNLINEISDKIKIPQKNIELFLDKNRSKPIKSFRDLEQFVTDQSKSNNNNNYYLPEIKADGLKIDIYFLIEPNFDNLVKLETLGKGAFGTVFKCVSIETKEEVAVKMLEIPSTDEINEYKLSIERELQFFNENLHHRRIVKYERYFKTENAIFLVMEYMKGGSLRSYIKKKVSLSESKIKIFAEQILEALQYLHEHKVIHRDVKTDNILLDEEENVKLCDFGLSESLTDLSTKDLLNGTIQSFVGTANYKAPEIMNDEPYGLSADVWSFGATLVEMMTGSPPCHKMNDCQVIMKICGSRMIEYNYPDYLSGNMKSFIDSCLQPEPNQRATIQQLMNHSFIQSN